MPSKRFKEAEAKVDKTKVYQLEEAVKLVKETSSVKFDASIEVHCRLGIDTKQSDQQIRGTITLPNPAGKTKRVAAFVEADKEAAAKAAGADLVGSEELIDQIVQKGKIDFDVAVATPSMMPKLAKAAKILGPKGLMPNPKTDTVGTNIEKMIKSEKAGKLTFKNDDTANVHLMIGKVSQTDQQIMDNFNAFIELLRKFKPSSSKGIYFRNCVITSAMGPGVRVEV